MHIHDQRRIAIYQALKHPWKQSGMPEPPIKIVKKCKLSIFFHHIQG